MNKVVAVRLILVAVIFVMVMNVSGNCRTDDDSVAVRYADIRELIELTGGKAAMLQSMEQMFQVMENGGGTFPPGFFEQFLEEFDVDGLIQELVPVYDRYYTHAEVRGLIDFYNTPLGRKALRVQPLLNKDMVELGAAWGQEAAMRALMKLYPMDSTGRVPAADSSGGNRSD